MALGTTGEAKGPEGLARLTAAVVRAPGRLCSLVFLAYKRWVSPLLPRACRFSPTCSEYARIAMLKHGVFKGSWRAAMRVLRCQPLHPGGVDLP